MDWGPTQVQTLVIACGPDWPRTVVEAKTANKLIPSGRRKSGRTMVPTRQWFLLRFSKPSVSSSLQQGQQTTLENCRDVLLVFSKRTMMHTNWIYSK